MDIPKSFRPERNLDDKTKQLEEKANIRKPTELEEVLEEFNHPRYRESEDLYSKIEKLRIKHNYKEMAMITLDYFHYHEVWAKQDNEKYKVLIQTHYIEKSAGYSFTTVKDVEKFCKDFKDYEQNKKKEIKLPLLWHIGSGAGSSLFGASFYSAIQFLTFMPKNPWTMLLFAIGSGTIGASIIPFINWRRKRGREKLYKNIIMDDKMAVEGAFS